MGLMSGVRDSEYCLVNFVGFGNKEFYIDELVEEFEVQYLDGGDGVDKQRVMNEVRELRVSEVLDGKLLCEDLLIK